MSSAGEQRSAAVPVFFFVLLSSLPRLGPATRLHLGCSPARTECTTLMWSRTTHHVVCVCRRSDFYRGEHLCLIMPLDQHLLYSITLASVISCKETGLYFRDSRTLVFSFLSRHASGRWLVACVRPNVTGDSTPEAECTNNALLSQYQYNYTLWCCRTAFTHTYTVYNGVSFLQIADYSSLSSLIRGSGHLWRRASSIVCLNNAPLNFTPEW